MADSDEAIQLRRRARRRLVGAIALVVLAVIVLPIIFDKEPKPISQDIVIQIPSQNSGRFNTKVVPPEPSKGAAADVEKSVVSPAPAEPKPAVVEPLKPAPVAKAAEPAKVPDAAKGGVSGKAPEAKVPVAKGAAPADAEAVRAQAALQGESWVVPLGAFLNQANVKTLQAKVTVVGIKSYSEVQKLAKGDQIRVRAGPFASRTEAERARDQLRDAGLTVGPVTKL